MKLSKTGIRRTALALFAAALVVPAAQAAQRPDNRAVGPRSEITQQPTRPDDRAGVRAVDGVVLGDRQGNVWGIATYQDTLANEPGATSTEQPLSSFYTPQALKAMGDRYNAEAALFAPVPAHVQDLEALNESYQQSGSAVRPDDRAGIRGVEQQPQTVYITQSRGFDWSDAGIGALSALGASLLLAGLMLLAVHQRRQHKVAAF